MIKKIQNDAGVRIQFKAGLFTPLESRSSQSSVQVCDCIIHIEMVCLHPDKPVSDQLCLFPFENNQIISV